MRDLTDCVVAPREQNYSQGDDTSEYAFKYTRILRISHNFREMPIPNIFAVVVMYFFLYSVMSSSHWCTNTNIAGVRHKHRKRIPI
jgi:hypothetical protein